MKKWLLVLSSLSILTTGISSTVAITYNNDYSTARQNLIYRYSQIANFAMRSAIVFDVNEIHPEWASANIKTKHIKDVWPEYFKNETKVKINTNLTFDELFFGTFGFDKYDYSMEKQMKVKDGTNIKKVLDLPRSGSVDDINIHPEDENFKLRKPDVELNNIIQLIGAGLRTLLGTGVNSQTMTILLGLLNQSFISDAIAGDQVNNIIKMVNEYLDFKVGDQTDQAISAILDAMTEKKVDASLTYHEVLTTDTNNLFKALLSFIYLKTIRDDANVNYSEVFFKRVGGVEDDRYHFDDINNFDTLNGVSYVIKFINSFFRYIAQFDQYRTIEFKYGDKHLFDPKINNEDIIGKILNKKYKPDENNLDDPTWFKVKNEAGEIEYYSIINPKDIIANLYYYLVPDKENDPNGLRLRKLMLMLISNGKDDNQDVENPLVNIVIKSGLGTILNQMLKKLTNISLDLTKIIGDFTQKLLLKLANNESIKKDLNGLIEAALLFVPAEWKPTLNKIKDYINDKPGSGYVEKPFSALYNGQLLPDLLNLLEPVIGSDVSKYAKLENIQTMLQTNIGDIWSLFSSDELPELVYALNKLSITDILTELANNYLPKKKNSNEFEPIAESYKDNFLNTQDLETLVNSLTPKNSNITDKNGKPIGLLNPLYLVLVAGNREINIKRSTATPNDKRIIDELEGVTVKRVGSDEPEFKLLELVEGKPDTYKAHSNAIQLLLGLNPSTKTFIPNTILYNLSRLYGDNYSQEEYDLNQHLITDETKDSLHRFKGMHSGMSKLFTALAPTFTKIIGDSETEYYNKHYAKYFANSNYEIKNLRYGGFDFNGVTPTGQMIAYDLIYHDPDSETDFTYHLLMTNGYYHDVLTGKKYAPDDFKFDKGGNVRRGWIMRELLRQD